MKTGGADRQREFFQISFNDEVGKTRVIEINLISNFDTFIEKKQKNIIIFPGVSLKILQNFSIF